MLRTNLNEDALCEGQKQMNILIKTLFIVIVYFLLGSNITIGSACTMSKSQEHCFVSHSSDDGDCEVKVYTKLESDEYFDSTEVS